MPGPPLFPRKLRLILDDNEGDAFDFGGLSVRFRVIQPSPRGIVRAHFAIFNLSPDTSARFLDRQRSDAAPPFKRLDVEAGYAQRSGVLFSGEITNVLERRDGPDKVTSFFARGAANARRYSFVNANFPAGSRLRTVVRAVAETFEGTSVGSLDAIEDQTLSGPWMFCEATRTALDKLARSFEFGWRIDQDVVTFFSTAPGARPPSPLPPIEISRETGMIGSPTWGTRGIQVVTLLHTAIRPGQLIRIRSAAPDVALSEGFLAGAPITPRNRERIQRLREGGVYEVRSVVHVGETRGQPWYSSIVAVPRERREAP